MQQNKNNNIIIYIFTIIVFSLFLFSCKDNKPIKPIKPKKNVFGFIDDSLNISQAEVKRNQSLTDILLPYDIPYETIIKMSAIEDSIFDARKVRAGNFFFIFRKNDSLNTITDIVYEIDQVNYVHFQLGDSLLATRGTKKITKKITAIAAVVNNSLFATIQQMEGDPELAIKMSEIFAWQINFYAIQKGDRFKVIYEEAFVENKYIGIGKIYGAIFEHRGKEFYGIYFDQGEGFEYFDENGTSLKKAFLKDPLKFKRISSRFSASRLHPVLKRRRPHYGIDFAAPVGTPVQAIGDGYVVEAHRKGGNGNFVKIKHNSVYESGYLHLSKYGSGIRPGAHVSQGQIIGYVGSTGLSSGPHLDLRFWKNGVPQNYLNMEFPPSKPVNEKDKPQYDSLKTALCNQLDLIKYLENNNKKTVINSLKL